MVAGGATARVEERVTAKAGNRTRRAGRPSRGPVIRCSPPRFSAPPKPLAVPRASIELRTQYLADLIIHAPRVIRAPITPSSTPATTTRSVIGRFLLVSSKRAGVRSTLLLGLPATACAPIRCPSRSWASAPFPSCRRLPASPGHRTGSIAGRSLGGASPQRRAQSRPTSPATCGGRAGSVIRGYGTPAKPTAARRSWPRRSSMAYSITSVRL